MNCIVHLRRDRQRASLPRLPWSVVAVAAVGAVIALLPAPAGLDPRAWHYFALFAALMLGVVFEPLPAPVIGLAGLAVAAVLHLPFSSQARWRLGLVFGLIFFGALVVIEVPFL